MRLNGRRESNNVDDRRRSFGGKAGLGIGGVIVAALIAWFMGGNPLDVLMSNSGSLFSGQEQEYTPTEQDEELARFSSQILAGTEDVWSEIFNQMGMTYEPPKLVLYTGSIQSGCGGASSSMGPFYCSADPTVYIDLSFFTQMKQTLGADGDFAYAYVIAHEVGHHVQYLLGILDDAHSLMARQSETEANRTSVKIELQADFLAGVWAHHDNARFSSLEPGDLQEALDAAHKIGDDYLQQKAQGYTVPESFNHGTSDQRYRWFSKGFTTGDLQQGDTFALPYNSL
ncbi:MAG: neutral zinc metallopeptidase [Lachnoclostridium sp.]|nr:neutral zinc metallopeptidase [Lachnoclostridium sp.]